MKEFKTKYLNPYTLLRDLLFNWWVILLAGLIGFSGCHVFNSLFVVEKYTSSTTVAVNLSGYTENATATSLSRTIEIATAFQNVLKSSALVDIVEEELGEKITGTLNVVQKEKTNLITISVTDISPEKAYKTLKLVYDNYHVLTDSAFSNIIISIISPPSMAEKSNIITVIIHSILTAFACMVLCILLILVISYFRDTLKNPSDIDELLDCKLFGTINHINKKERKYRNKLVGLMMTNPLINYKFSNSFREIAIKLLSLQRTKKIKSVSITSIAENEGKTTVSVNIALALTEMGKKVALIDCDFKLPAVYKFFSNVKIEGTKELAEYLRGNTNYESIVHKDKHSGLYILCGQKRYNNSSEILSSERFEKLLKKLEEDFDFVIIDTPPGGIAIDSEIISEKTSALLLVVRQDFAPVEQINNYISNISEDKLLGCVFNNISTIKIKHNSDDYNRYYI